MRLSRTELHQIADSGQVFRFNHIDEDTFDVRSGDRRLVIKAGDEITDPYWINYFDLNTDYGKYMKAVPKSDKYLTKAVQYSSGIRILNQDPWEMMVSFIISQRKSIPAIKTSIEKLCETFGRRKKDSDGTVWYTFPTAKEIMKGTMDDILACSVGYRAEYIYKLAEAVARNELVPEKLRALSDEELYQELLGIRGVGAKVANCVMLFGYHRIGAFPIDVWIQRVIDEYYDGSFPLGKYEGFAGIIQQYLFFYSRSIAKVDKF